jgi:hypothetical protein
MSQVTTDHLKRAAQAAQLTVMFFEDCPRLQTGPRSWEPWNPQESDKDCEQLARMADLLTTWDVDRVSVFRPGSVSAQEYFSDHGWDSSKARRVATVLAAASLAK